MTKYPKILSQGIFDGYCLLYAIMNAYKVLSAPNASAYTFAQKNIIKWQKLIALSPSLENFSSGNGSVFGLSTAAADIRATKNLIDTYLHAVSEKTKYIYSVESIDKHNVREINFSESVLIFSLRTLAETACYTGLDHWVCGVDMREESILLACSYALHKCGSNYKESRVSKERDCYFNNEIPVIQVESGNIYEKSIYCIKKQKNN